MNNIGSDFADWKQKPFRTLTAALAGLVTLVVVGLGAMYGFIGIMSGAGQCEELAFLMCGIIAVPLAAATAMLGEVMVARHLLRKKSVSHSVAIPLLAGFTALIFLYAFAGVLYGSMPLFLTGGFAFVTSFMFYDWFLNATPGALDSKILRTIAGLVVVIIVGFLLSFFL